MAYGHEVWLGNCVRKGNKVSVYGFYGHKLVADKPMPEGYTNAILFDDAGRAPNPDKKMVEDPAGWKFTFKDEGADVYTMYVESNSVWVTNDEGRHRGVKRDYKNVIRSNASNLSAKKIISKDGKNPGGVMHATLEIMPKAATFKVGGKAEAKILYEGKPLGGVACKVYNAGWQDILSVNADGKGSVEFLVDKPGTYIIIARYVDKDKSVCDEFDETAFTTTLTFDAV